MKPTSLVFFAAITFLISCKYENNNPVIGTGQMPNAVIDISGNIHVVYGNGDSILYCYSFDHGNSFSHPSLVAVIPKLAASHMRGPQIAALQP